MPGDFPERIVAGILGMIRMLGGMISCEAKAAVRDGELHEIKSAVILQPGPAALTDGLAGVHALIRRWAERPR